MNCYLQKPNVTHLDLLKKVDPMLGAYYDEIISKAFTPLEKFDSLSIDIF
jgi:hypothetical protein